MAKTEKTGRGFGFIDFNDAYGQECSVQESSNVVPHIWFGIDVDLDKKEVNQRMHLNVKQVKNLIPILQYFVEHEQLPARYKKINP